MNRAAENPKGAPLQSFAIHFPPSLTPPFISRFGWGAGQEGGGDPGRGEARGGGGKTQQCPPSPDNSEATATPPLAAAAAAAAKPSRALCTQAARSECRLPLAAAAAGQPRAQRRSDLPSRPGWSPLGPPPAPRGPFQTPWARGGCSGRKRWPRLGRRGSERGGGGAPGTVSPATRRGRARGDTGSSRSTAGARRRRWQREPRDRSITGSHGARAFSSLGAGASARHSSSGRKGPAPEPPRRAASRSPPLPPQPARPHPAAPEAGEGGGRRRRRLLSRRRWWPDGLVQRLQPTPFKGTRGGVGRCRRTGRARGWVPREGGGRGRAEAVVTSALLRLRRIPQCLAASGEEGPAPERRRRRGDGRREKAAAGGGGRRGRREDGVCACAPAPQT